MFFITMNAITKFCTKIIWSFFIIGDYWIMNFVVLMYAGAKGQLISKQNCRAVTSSKRWMKCFSGCYPECVSFIFRKKLQLDNFVWRSTDLYWRNWNDLYFRHQKDLIIFWTMFNKKRTLCYLKGKLFIENVIPVQSYSFLQFSLWFLLHFFEPTRQVINLICALGCRVYLWSFKL